MRPILMAYFPNALCYAVFPFVGQYPFKETTHRNVASVYLTLQSYMIRPYLITLTILKLPYEYSAGNYRIYIS